VKDKTLSTTAFQQRGEFRYGQKDEIKERKRARAKMREKREVK